MTTTATETTLRQGHCRGCAKPTIMFDPALTYRPDQWYCDNCYGLPNRYSSTDHGNTGPDDCLTDEYEWTRCYQLNNNNQPPVERIAYYLPPLGLPGVGSGTMAEVEDEDDPEDDPRICECGSTRFEIRTQVTGTRYYEEFDIADYDEGTRIYAPDHGVAEDDVYDEEGPEVFCASCGNRNHYIDATI